MLFNALLALVFARVLRVASAENVCGVAWDAEGCGASLAVYTGTTRFAEIPSTVAVSIWLYIDYWTKLDRNPSHTNLPSMGLSLLQVMDMVKVCRLETFSSAEALTPDL